MSQKDILVFADWKGMNGPIKIGNLHCVFVRGKEVFYFEYDKEWINSGKYHFLDPATLKKTSGQCHPST